MIKAELDILRNRLRKQRHELIEVDGGMDRMISCFESAIEYAQNVKEELLPNEMDVRFEGLNEPRDADYLIRDNYAWAGTADYGEYCTHVSWTYKLLKEFMDTLDEYKELHVRLN